MRNYDIVLDLKLSDQGLDDIWFYQGDLGGTLTVTLQEEGKPLLIPEGGQVMCFFERKDKQVVQRELTLQPPKTSEYVVNIDTAILEVVGKIKCEVKVYHEDCCRTTFSSFNITCKKSMSIESSVDTPEKLDLINTVNAHAKLLQDINLYLESNTADKEQINTKILDITTNLSQVLKYVTDVEQKVDNNQINITKSMELMTTQFNEVIRQLNEDNNTKFQQVIESHNKLVQDVNTFVQSLNKSISDLSTSTDTRFQQVGEAIEDLQLNKVSIIVSEELPDTTGLPLGTLCVLKYIPPEPEV